jgi:HAD superfamily hydrolase (TIGR01509 family)
VKIPKDLQAVFIDLDGTLVDSLPKLYGVYLEFLKKYEIEGSEREFDEINGPSLPEVLQILKARYQLPDTIHLLIKQYQGQINKLYEDESIVMEGAIETLTYLKKKHFKLTLVTSAAQEFARLALKTLQLDSIFDEIITGEMVHKGKPNPDIYLLALKKGNFKAENVIVIEDSMHGVKAALGAGIYPLRLNKKIDKSVWHEGWGELENWKQIQTLFQGGK